MFKPEMFLLPNGEQMSAGEIAEMLNSWKEAPTPVKLSIPMSHSIEPIGIHSVPVMRSSGVGMLSGSYSSSTYSSVQKMDIPIYPREEVIRLISDMMYSNVANKNVTAIGAVLGPDYYLSLNQGNRYNEPVEMLNTMYGAVKIHLGEEMSTIKFIYTNKDWGRIL